MNKQDKHLVSIDWLILMWVVFSCLWLVFLMPASSSSYQYDYAYSYFQRANQTANSFVSREAAALDDWIERGNAHVVDSPRFQDGLRLECQGTQEKPAMAAAIYKFEAPSANYLRIKVYYRDASEDDDIAGRLFIRTKDEYRKTSDEKICQGDTFVLRSGRMSETIHLTTEKYITDDTLEIHIVADGQDVVDIKKIQLKAVDEEPEIKIVKRYYRDYWTEYPRYRYIYDYYYYGPYYWPTGYYTYIRWTWPDRYYWTVWRPWYRSYVRVYVRDPSWYRCYTVIYDDPPVDCDDPPAVRKRRRRVSRSVVKRSRRRSHSEGTKRLKKRLTDRTHRTRNVQKRRRKNPVTNRSYHVKKRRRSRSDTQKSLRRRDRRKSVIKKRRDKGLLEKIFSYFSEGRHEKHRRSVHRGHQEIRTHRKHKRHSLSDVIRLLSHRRSSTKRRRTTSHVKKLNRSHSSSSHSRTIHKHRRSNDDDEEEERSRSQRRHQKRRR